MISVKRADTRRKHRTPSYATFWGLGPDPFFPSPVWALLTHLPWGFTRGRSGWRTRCPACREEAATLFIRQTDDGALLLRCRTGCAPATIVQACGLRPEYFPLCPIAWRGRATAYAYHDAQGALLFHVLRFEDNPWDQNVALRLADGRYGYLGHLPPVPHVLYRLPEVRRAAQAGVTVYLVRSEAIADRLAGIGVTATTTPTGSLTHCHGYREALCGARVRILRSSHLSGWGQPDESGRLLDGIARKVFVLVDGPDSSSPHGHARAPRP